MGKRFNGAETNCGIAHVLGILLLDSYNFQIFWATTICRLSSSKLNSQVFEEDALQWEEKLNRIHDVFDVWIDVQRRWVYLDGIFSGSADIKALLPVETQRFQRWVKVGALIATPDLLQISDIYF